MDYKSVLEEQIRELQKAQDENSKISTPLKASEMCNTARTILDLIREARNM
jgi:hypothetical protein